MNDEINSSQIETVYQEAGQWLRTVNQIIWAMGSIFVPLSLSCLWFAVNASKGRSFLAFGSIFLFALWVYVSELYRDSCHTARTVLMTIEEQWAINEKISLYKLHGDIGKRRTGLFNAQLASLHLLIVIWVVLLVFYRY